MRLSTKVAYNTIIQIISKAISIILGLVAVAFIFRYLGTEGFGEYTTIITFLSFFSIVADLGLTLVTVQLISKPGVDQDKVLGNLLSLRIVSAFLFLGLAPVAVIFFPYSQAVKEGVLALTLSFFFIALNQVFVGIFQKNLRLDKVSIAEIFSRIVLVAGVIYVVKMGYGLNGILLATVFSSFISFVLHFYFSKKFAVIKLHFDIAYWKEIIYKSWPLAITIFLNLLYLKTDILFLSLMKRSTDIGIIAEVGLYGAAYKVIDVVIIFPFMFAGIVLPILTGLWARKDNDGFKMVLQKSFDVLVIIAVPLIIGTQFVSHEVMLLIAGADFVDSAPILQCLIIAAGMIFGANMFAHAIIAIDKQKSAISIYLITAFTSLLGYYFLIPVFSYWGAAWVTIYSEAFIMFGSIYLIYKFTKFLPNMAVFFKSLFASFFMAAGIYLLKFFGYFYFPLVLSFAVIIYFIFIFLFKALSKEDVKILLNK